MPSQQTTAEANKALVRRWVELWNSHQVAAVDDLVAPNYVRHDPNTPEVRGAEAEKQLITMVLSAFPDLHFTIEDLTAEGDTVAGRYIMRGTHQGAWLGIPPTNSALTLTVMEFYRIAEGKIAEQWVILDALGMLQQLGVIPPPGQATS
jgi:steroid delta-isomerase-like uncharacterized protein